MRYAMRANSQFGDGVVLGTPGARGLGYLVILQRKSADEERTDWIYSLYQDVDYIEVEEQLQGNMCEICDRLEQVTKLDDFTGTPQ